MLGLLVIMILSWLILWAVKKKDLRVLGIYPTRERVVDFVVGFLAAGILFGLYCLIITLLAPLLWERNIGFGLAEFAAGSWWTFRSVLFEEFLFRGALLFLAIGLMGVRWACLLSAVAFGIYHWFSYGVFGNPSQMAMVFLSTGLWGFIFAWAFAKTRSLYLPTGLHTGHNLFSIVVFSQGPLGKQWLFTEGGNNLTGNQSLGVYLFSLLALPLFTLYYLSRRARIIQPNISG